MKQKPERKEHLALTMLFSFVVFCILFITIIIVNAGVLFLARTGVLKSEHLNLSPVELVMMLIAVASLIFGTLISAIAARIPLKPFNTIISGLNQLASGNYKARIRFGRLLRRHPAMEEMTESFNTLAEELENTEMLRADFINNFSHEFKTPIVSIAGFAKVLKRGHLTEQEQAEYLDIIEEESLRLANMATNVLNLTKVENQAILTDIEAYNLSEQIRGCILVLERQWSKKQIDFSLEFGEHQIEANEELLKQVWLNLLDNAVKFSPCGRTVEVRIRTEGESVQVSVINEGNEIPPEAQKRIFNKFYQADESHAAEGNGIGLAVVKCIVQLHGGMVTVHSENGLTMFTVRLPRYQQVYRPL